MSEITIKYLLALLFACAATGASAETIVGRVVGVADGDTITVLDADKVQHKVRVAGIEPMNLPNRKRAPAMSDCGATSIQPRRGIGDTAPGGSR